MSIEIIKKRCVGCNKCLGVCPGNLLSKGDDGKVLIKYPKDCWGCTACLKECRFGAIKYYLGADIGARVVIFILKMKVIILTGILQISQEMKV